MSGTHFFGGTWWQDLVARPGGKTHYQHDPSGSGDDDARKPTPQAGNMITLTHSYTHPERHHKNPKDISLFLSFFVSLRALTSFGKKSRKNLSLFFANGDSAPSISLSISPKSPSRTPSLEACGA